MCSLGLVKRFVISRVVVYISRTIVLYPLGSVIVCIVSLGLKSLECLDIGLLDVDWWDSSLEMSVFTGV